MKKVISFIKKIFLSKTLKRREKRIDNLTNEIINKYCCCHDLEKMMHDQNFPKAKS